MYGKKGNYWKKDDVWIEKCAFVMSLTIVHCLGKVVLIP